MATFSVNDCLETTFYELNDNLVISLVEMSLEDMSNFLAKNGERYHVDDDYDDWYDTDFNITITSYGGAAPSDEEQEELREKLRNYKTNMPRPVVTVSDLRRLIDGVSDDMPIESIIYYCGPAQRGPLNLAPHNPAGWGFYPKKVDVDL